jgi:DNA mismatch repair protein MutL
MSEIIKLLPDHVANQIAAGEVVQRPASVVKELIENAVDAGATQITLLVKDAGKTLVQVIDNGKGMSMLDARMAFERHATSKIATADDLFNLYTKGFRGEALASVAAIAHVSLKSKREEDDLGTHLEIEGSKVTSQEPVVTPVGTIINVRNLFYNVPARRKFLKSDAVELRAITDEFHRVAMAHPHSAMRFIHNDNELFDLPSSNHRQRIIGIMGGKTNDALIPVEEETELLTITGFIGKPEFARKTKGLQYFFVNDRFIKHNYLHHAVTAAFEGLLRNDVNPTYFLYLTVPRDSVDINIHPTKTEVKFDDEHNLYAILRASVKHALGQFHFNALDFEKEPEFEVPYGVAVGNIRSPRIDVDRSFNPFDINDGKLASANTSSYRAPQQHAWEALYAGLDKESQLTVEHEPAAASGLFEHEQTLHSSLFQLQRKFIISPMSSGLLVVNQSRAHERILYEQLLKQLTVQNGVSQQLLFPLILHYPVEEVRVLKNIQELLESTGFIFKTLEHNLVEIEGLPLDLKEAAVPGLLEAVIKHEQHELPSQDFSPVERLAVIMASSISIKTGEQLQPEAMQHIVDTLFACKQPSLSPAGKKVFINITGDNLQAKFD